MKSAFEKLCQDSLCLWLIALSLFLISLGIIFLVIFWSRFPPQVPLFYSQTWGEGRLAPKIQVIFLPAFAFLIFFLNLFLSARFFIKDVFLSRILIGTGFVLVLALVLTLFQITNLIT